MEVEKSAAANAKSIKRTEVSLNRFTREHGTRLDINALYQETLQSYKEMMCIKYKRCVIHTKRKPRTPGRRRTVKCSIQTVNGYKPCSPSSTKLFNQDKLIEMKRLNIYHISNRFSYGVDRMTVMTGGPRQRGAWDNAAFCWRWASLRGDLGAIRVANSRHQPLLP